MRSPSLLLLAAVLAALLTTACRGLLQPSRSALSGGPGVDAATPELAARLFYPLDLGNHWLYHEVFVLRPEVPTDLFPPSRIGSRLARDLMCVEVLDGGRYVVEHTEQTDSVASGTRTAHQYVRYRQDRSGLYEADVDIGSPPECAGSEPAMAGSWNRRDAIAAALRSDSRLGTEVVDRIASETARRLETALAIARPAAARENELTRLRYPLTTGASWIVRSDPLFIATVEGIEAISVPGGTTQAYRVRVQAPAFFGPHDRVQSWFSRSGLVQMRVHLEIPTQEFGTLLADELLTLEDLAIARGRF